MLGANDIKAIANFGAAGKLAAAERKARRAAAYNAGVAAFNAGLSDETDLEGVDAAEFVRGYEFARLSFEISKM